MFVSYCLCEFLKLYLSQTKKLSQHSCFLLFVLLLKRGLFCKPALNSIAALHLNSIGALQSFP